MVKVNIDWLRRFFPFEKGIPKHDTIARVISRLSPKGLQDSFVDWVQSIANLTDREVIAIDGKKKDALMIEKQINQQSIWLALGLVAMELF